MSETTVKTPQAGSGSASWLLPALAAIALLAGLVAFYFLPASLPAALRWVALVAGVAAGLGLFAVSQVGRSLITFVADSRVELRKMVWPTMDETWRTTLLVVVFVVSLGAFFALVDALLGWGTRQLFGGGV